ncbi:GNAT family N-acetyltransferase [Paenibacillus sp. CAA11]|uniref:GNAT family N-acetyltransferase n=1 Tax=Paenibacillus sp. CAA11 TaxID=1532905 RepID=UPI000D35D1E2|nr:GNAT family N-acetyltransferase [Paenibacillus sp. CAA11]AWB43123.1 GNAT family N-acetyltransferase [Paenibacillus sp. CAA11]
MQIRKFQGTDIDQIITLFYETVHTVNRQDYSPEQLEAWASRSEEQQRHENWLQSLSTNISYVAQEDRQIVGFADINRQGYLDRLFVHKDYQGQGIASALVDVLESEARKLNMTEIDTDASMTAKPFFEHKGYRVVQSQTVQRRGVELQNFRMRKSLR